MADENQTINVSITASIKGLVDGLRNAGSQVQSAATGMQSSLNTLQSGIGAIGKAFGVVSAVLAGGKMFKDAMDATLKWNLEAMKLARTLGVTTEEASILNMALGDIYTDSATYINATQMLARQVATGGDAFKKLGVDVQDSNGKLKPTPELMQDVLAKLNSMEAGTSRNAAGAAIFGRQWGEAQKILKLTATTMQDAKEKAERLHLVVGPEGVAMTNSYRAAMNDVDDVLTSLQVQIGSAVLPALTELGVFFGDIGPGLAAVLRAAITDVTIAFRLLQFVVEVAVQVITEVLMSVWHVAEGLANALYKLFTGDFKGAWSALKDGWNSVVNEVAAGMEETGASYEKMLAGIRRAVTGPTPKASSKDTGGGLDFDPNASEKSKAAAAAKKKAEEEARKAAQESHEAALENLKAEMDAVQQNAQKKLAVQEQVIAEEIRVHGKGSKEVIAAEREKAKILREIEEEQTALRIQAAKHKTELELLDVEAQEENLAHLADLGKITVQEELNRTIELENRKLEIRKAGLEAQLEDERLTEEQRREIRNQEEVLEKEHQLKLDQIRNKAALDQKKAAQSSIDPIMSAYKSAINGLLVSTMSFGQAVKTIFAGIRQSIANVITDMVMDWTQAEIKKLAITMVTKAKEILLHKTTAADAVATTTTTATAEITAAGAVAGANAAASAAQTPVIGWTMAIPAMVAVMAAVLALRGSISSAAGGWDMVPSDQMVQLHKNEMVLSSPMADGLRNIIKNGQTGGTAKGGDVYHVEIKAMDSKSFRQFAKDQQGALVDVVKDAVRNRRK